MRDKVLARKRIIISSSKINSVLADYLLSISMQILPLKSFTSITALTFDA